MLQPVVGTCSSGTHIQPESTRDLAPQGKPSSNDQIRTLSSKMKIIKKNQVEIAELKMTITQIYFQLFRGMGADG